MNKALEIKNWNEGGNSYVLKGNSKNKWVGFQVTVIDELVKKFNDEFNIVIWTDPDLENDYYCIPFSSVKHLFVEERMTTGKFKNRWTAIIKDGRFLMHSNQKYSEDISHFYSAELLPKSSIEINDDFFIENAKAEINVRYGQSKFRKGVLKNFNNKCGLTGISESSLIRASHIVPWAHRKDCRGDITNGISLYCEIDTLFDSGYISFSDNYEIIISDKFDTFSKPLKEQLNNLRGRELNTPKKGLKSEYLEYHRKNILK